MQVSSCGHGDRPADYLVFQQFKDTKKEKKEKEQEDIYASLVLC